MRSPVTLLLALAVCLPVRADDPDGNYVECLHAYAIEFSRGVASVTDHRVAQPPYTSAVSHCAVHGFQAGRRALIGSIELQALAFPTLTRDEVESVEPTADYAERVEYLEWIMRTKKEQ